MKNLVILIIGLLVWNKVSGQSRKIDLAISVVKPSAGEIIESRNQAYNANFRIYNLGLDTIKPSDFYNIKITFGNVSFAPKDKFIGKFIPPKDSSELILGLQMRFDTDNFNVPFCATIKLFSSNSDSLSAETGNSLTNNSACKLVDHKSKLSLNSTTINDFKVFPNPASKKIFVLDNNHLLSVKDQPRIYDHKGIEVGKRKVIILGNLTEIDLEGLNAGVYTLKFNTREKVITCKFIVCDE